MSPLFYGFMRGFDFALSLAEKSYQLLFLSLQSLLSRYKSPNVFIVKDCFVEVLSQWRRCQDGLFWVLVSNFMMPCARATGPCTVLS